MTKFGKVAMHKIKAKITLSIYIRKNEFKIGTLITITSKIITHVGINLIRNRKLCIHLEIIIERKDNLSKC